MSAPSRGLARLRAKGYDIAREGEGLRFLVLAKEPEPLDVAKTRDWLARHRLALLRILEAEARPEVAELMASFAGLGCRVVSFEQCGKKRENEGARQ